MTESSPALARFQSLLRELFQFDSADLDFGIYRILNTRRHLFADWIEKDLPASVRKALSAGAAAVADAQVHRLEELATKLRVEHEDDTVIDGDGQLRTGIAGKTAREYRELWQARQASRQPAGAEREAEMYNRLYDFFRRYYEDGDFLSLRRYGADDAYAVPYNGQEVMLHWANRDQYYVKTGEHFTDYRFRAGDAADAWHVELRLQQAETDRDNTKSSDKRHFFFDAAKVAVDAASRTLNVPVAWRAATEAEADVLPTRNPQDAINVETEKKLLGKQALKEHPALLAALKANVADEDEEPRSLLARHLRRYTRRNTSDFFIHKDLCGFLTRELDYWLKAEVLKLDTLLAGGEQPAQAWLQTLACLRDVATTIIDFVARIEDFQKRLYEKRKFVTECQWCVRLDYVDRAGLTDTLVRVLNATEGGKAQKAEWKRLFAIDEVKAEGGKPGWKDKVTAEFLRRQPSLMLDTAHMPEDFTDVLLASIDDIDAATSGLLVHGDNWQALNLLNELYRQQIRCLYIDPPYNTDSDGFAYKDSYRHSSWLAMMNDRVGLGRRLLSSDGVLLSSVDDIERGALTTVLDGQFGRSARVGSLVWKGATDNNPTRIAVEHEYILCYAMSKDDLEEHWSSRTSDTKDFMLVAFQDICAKTASVKRREELFNAFAAEHREALGDLFRYRRFDARGLYAARRNMENPGKPGYQYDVFHPVTKKACTKPYWGWRFSEATMQLFLDEDRIIFGDDEKKIPELKVYLVDVRFPLRSVFAIDARKGSNDLHKLFGARDIFKNPKPAELLEHFLPFASSPSAIVGDYFAGSGTTGQAVINLNRKDGGHRRFVLVEQGNYFDALLVSRLKKISYAPEWKDGKPKRYPTSEEIERSPGIIKVVRLESYEDTLSNLRLRANLPGQRGFDLDAFPDTYRLGYWLDVETVGSASLLDVEKLEQPFDYALDVHEGQVSRSRKVDLGETFNYLIGLIAQRRQALDRDGRRNLLYLGRTRADDVATAVLWRDIHGWTADDFAAERDWIAAQAPFGDASVVYVNGDSAIPGAQSLDSVFHARMFAPVH